jgi:hypothetical protein
MSLDDNLSDAIGAPFRIKFPNYPDDEKYDFSWNEICMSDNPYRKIFNAD